MRSLPVRFPVIRRVVWGPYASPASFRPPCFPPFIGEDNVPFVVGGGVSSSAGGGAVLLRTNMARDSLLRLQEERVQSLSLLTLLLCEGGRWVVSAENEVGCGEWLWSTPPPLYKMAAPVGSFTACHSFSTDATLPFRSFSASFPLVSRRRPALQTTVGTGSVLGEGESNSLTTRMQLGGGCTDGERSRNARSEEERAS